nr:hypothetical protein [Salinispora fenicalii]
MRGGKGNRFRAGGGGGDQRQVGGRVELALLLVAAVVTGVLASIVPAWRAARISPAQSWTR